MCSSASDICAFKPEQQPVVEVLQVIDPVSVDDQRVGQRAELKQPLQLRVRARQPRDLQPEDRADLPQAHPRDQLLVPLARLRVANRPEIPRSPSTTTIRSASQPSLAASSASAY